MPKIKERISISDAQLKSELIKLFNSQNTDKGKCREILGRKYKIQVKRFYDTFNSTMKQWQITQEKAQREQIIENTKEAIKEGLKLKLERQLEIQNDIKAIDEKITSNQVEDCIFIKGEKMLHIRQLYPNELAILIKTKKELHAELSKMAGKKIKIKDLTFDDKNFNKGTEYGKSLMNKSFEKFGAGRSILIDKNNKIIAGNKSAETFAELGLEDIEIVETDGKKLIAVKRTDIDLDTPEGRELALADNQTAKVNIDFDFEVLESELDSNTIEEWGVDTGYSLNDELGENFSLPNGDKAPFQQMTFTLADEQAEQIKNAISDIKQTKEFKYAETMGNENSNGNALYLIIMQWGEQKK